MVPLWKETFFAAFYNDLLQFVREWNAMLKLCDVYTSIYIIFQEKPLWAWKLIRKVFFLLSLPWAWDRRIVSLCLSSRWFIRSDFETSENKKKMQRFSVWRFQRTLFFDVFFFVDVNCDQKFFIAIFRRRSSVPDFWNGEVIDQVICRARILHLHSNLILFILLQYFFLKLMYL